MLLVQHSVCEHGALIHGAEAEAASERRTPEKSREQAVHQDDASDEASAHEHCDAATILHKPEVTAHFVGSAVLLRVDPPSALISRDVRVIALIDLAPKGSPPRA